MKPVEVFERLCGKLWVTGVNWLWVVRDWLHGVQSAGSGGCGAAADIIQDPAPGTKSGATLPDISQA